MIDWFNNLFWRTIDWLQAYNGAVTAFATFWIAIFTVVLALVSRRQARLTKRTADIAERALVELERPVLYVIDNFSSINNPLSDEGGGNTTRCRIANYGRTPATIYEICEQFFKGDDLPSEPRYSNKKSIQMVVAPGTSIRMTSPKISPGTYYFGYLKYRDILGLKYTKGFGFMPGGGLIDSPKYNYEIQPKN
jgi:hypothetical protein